MEITSEQKLAKYKEITSRYLEHLNAGRIVYENQVRKFCVTQIIEMWGFVAGFGDAGTYTEEELAPVGTTGVWVDNVLHLNGTTVMVESKAPNENLDDHIPQLVSYVSLKHACLGIITNGTEWRVYLVNRNGEMFDTPFKVFDIRSATDSDVDFFVNIFNNKLSVNTTAMLHEQATRYKKEEFDNKCSFFLTALKEFSSSPSDEWIKEKIRSFENIASVSPQKLEDYKTSVIPAITSALKDEICKTAILEAKQAENTTNKLEAGEYAIYNGCRVYANQKGIKISFVDDEDAKCSHLEDANTGRKLMYILGDIDANTGWTLKGIAFPSKNKGKGTTIPLSKIEDMDEHLDTLMWVAENIERPMTEWASLYDQKFNS